MVENNDENKNKPHCESLKEFSTITNNIIFSKMICRNLRYTPIIENNLK